MSFFMRDRARCADKSSYSPAADALSKRSSRWAAVPLACVACFGVFSSMLVTGCASDMQRIDREVNRLMAMSTRGINAGETSPDASRQLASQGRPFPLDQDPNTDITAETVRTINPGAQSILFGSRPPEMETMEEIIDRLEGYNLLDESGVELDLPGALAYALEHSRDQKFEEESYILTALRLLIERHQWGPRFFDDISANFDSFGDNGFFDSSVSLVNDLRVTQRLPYGGEVSARALATLSEDLHSTISTPGTQDIDIIFTLDLPLLRGAGTVARESLIQANRDMIYAARDFERFRREFLVDIASDFLDLVVSQKQIQNNERRIVSLELTAKSVQAEYEAGRKRAFEAELAQNEVFDAEDSLNSSKESYRLSVDRFKLRIGMDIDTPLTIMPSRVGVPRPDVTREQAVVSALNYRLDLQNQRDGVDDSQRDVENTRNDLLPDLNFDASVTIPTNPDKNRAGVDFDGEETSFSAGLFLSLPLDREIERFNLRTSQINYERSVRSYEEFRDNVIINVRAAVRSIDRAALSLDLQEANVAAAANRLASTEANEQDSTVRDRTEAANALASAEDARDGAIRDLEVAILDYLLESGQLRVNELGFIQPLDGMEMLGTEIPVDPDDTTGGDPGGAAGVGDAAGDSATDDGAGAGSGNSGNGGSGSGNGGSGPATTDNGASGDGATPGSGPSIDESERLPSVQIEKAGRKSGSDGDRSSPDGE